jgi:hypothetical protein
MISQLRALAFAVRYCGASHRSSHLQKAPYAVGLGFF